MNLDKLGIKNIKPVVSGRPQTKAGRMSLRGTLNGKNIKIFECHNSAQAEFIYSFTNTGPLSSFFPHTYQSHNAFVICDWVLGKAINERLPFLSKDNISKFFVQSDLFLNKLHSIPSNKNACGFDYIEDYIKPRFINMCEMLELKELQHKLLSSIETLSQKNKALCHPDLKPSNVVFNNQGQMVIIDNELLGCCSIPVLDELNLLQGLSKPIIKSNRAALQNILKDTLDLMSSDKADDLFNVWMIRKFGSLFDGSRADEIKALAEMTITEQKKHILLWRQLESIAA